MNFEFNIFGKKSGKPLQYKSSNTSVLYEIAENCQTDTQITVYRENSLPWFCRYIIAATIFFSYLCLLSLAISLFNYKK
jgi:hypothetical protein